MKKKGLVAVFALAALAGGFTYARDKSQDILAWSAAHDSACSAVFAVKALGADPLKLLDQSIDMDSTRSVTFAVKVLGANPNPPKIEFRSTPLLDAVYKHKRNAEQTLVRLGADPNGWPMKAAVDVTDVEILQDFLKAGADPSKPDDALLETAAGADLLDVTKALMSSGRIPDWQIDRALWAAATDTTSGVMVEYLLKTHKFEQVQKDVALNGAAFTNHLKPAEALLKADANPYLLRGCGVQEARENGDFEMANLLTVYGKKRQATVPPCLVLESGHLKIALPGSLRHG